MSIDGFEPGHAQPFQRFSRTSADQFFRLMRFVSRRLGVEFSGLDKLPQGRALLVTNHTFGWDSAFPMAEIWCEQGRPLWALGEHVWWKFPFLRSTAASVGVVDGSPEHVDQLLSREELVLVLPGGLRESVKPRELKYRLMWGHRYGFVRAAIRNQAPIVPFASLGGDDLFDFVGNAYARGERLLRRKGIPLPLPARILPIPHAVRFRFVFGDPIPPRAPAHLADDPALLKQVRHEVEGELHELIEDELAKRAGVPIV